ncbi:hypothetical protein QBC36DRAFT_376684 [Triangularia setosa]|uniref:Uncharacterized protein n=1 Tax=Triangularia setosa TaxID=2587417 RepID=A0AAN7A9S0_9PEZI|nr:hypothetical protein QBC36DRAFT_376684 [Podospora setosa]
MGNFHGEVRVREMHEVYFGSEEWDCGFLDKQLGRLYGTEEYSLAFTDDDDIVVVVVLMKVLPAGWLVVRARKGITKRTPGANAKLEAGSHFKLKKMTMAKHGNTGEDIKPDAKGILIVISNENEGYEDDAKKRSGELHWGGKALNLIPSHRNPMRCPEMPSASKWHHRPVIMREGLGEWRLDSVVYKIWELIDKYMTMPGGEGRGNKSTDLDTGWLWTKVTEPLHFDWESLEEFDASSTRHVHPIVPTISLSPCQSCMSSCLHTPSHMGLS